MNEEKIDFSFKNAWFYRTKVINEEFKIKSSFAELCIKNRKDVIVVDEDTNNLCLLTPFDMAVEGISDNSVNSTYQDTKFSFISFKWETDSRLSTDTFNIKLLSRMHWQWFNLLRKFIDNPKFKEILTKVNNDRKVKKIYPEVSDVFKMYSFNPDNIKVAFFFQDPYPNDHANGIATATNKKTLPSTLKQIQNGIREDLEKDSSWNIDPTLLDLINQGVYFFNTALTVKENSPGSYINDWKPFTAHVLQVMNKFTSPVIFVLCGKAPKELSPLIDKDFHTVFELEHPAAASYSDRSWEYKNVFSKVNNILSTPINWLNR